MRRWLEVLREHRALIVVAMLSSALTALGLTMLDDPHHRAEALIEVRPSITDPSIDAAGSGRLVASQVAVIEGDLVRNEVATRTVPDPPAVHARAVGDSDIGDSDIVAVWVETGSAESARRFADSYVQAYLVVRSAQNERAVQTARAEFEAQLADLRSQLDVATDEQTRITVEAQIDVLSQSLAILQAEAAIAQPPAEMARAAIDVPIGRDPWGVVLLALLAGSVVGVAGALVVNRVDDVVRLPGDLRDLAETHPLLAVVPNDPGASLRPLKLRRSADPASTAYRQLRDALPGTVDDRDLGVVQVTALRSGMGSTTTAVNLAAMLAETGGAVTLVDADLRHPRIHELLMIDGSIGLSDVLGNEPLDMAILPLDDHLSVLAAGTPVASPLPMLSRRHTDQVMDDLRGRSSVVVIDTSAVLEHGDATAVSRHVDGVVLVVSVGAHRCDVDDALAMLSGVGSTVLGIVLNDPGRRVRRGQRVTELGGRR